MKTPWQAAQTHRLTPETFDTRPMFRFYLVTEHLFTFSLVAHIFLVLLFLSLRVLPMVYYNIFSIALFAFCIRLTRRRHHYLAFFLGALEVALHALLATMYVSTAAGFHLMVLTLGPCMFLLPFERDYPKWLLVSLPLAFFLSIHFLLGDYFGLSDFSGTAAEIYFIANIVVLVLSLSILSFYLSKASWTAENYISYLTQIDPLTDILNRRGMESAMETARQQVALSNSTIAIIMCDIDDFKQVNDNYGHEFGDRVIQEIVSRMHDALRNSDKIGRWGGEEFLILLPETDIIGAKIVADKVLAAVNSSTIDHNGTPLQISVTIGVSILQPSESLHHCIGRADDAMYRGKQSGKNRVVLDA